MKLSNLTSDFIRAEIVSLSQGRFIVESEDLLSSVLEEISSELLSDKVIVNLKRDWHGSAGRRTLLITVLDSQSEIKNALRWAAAVKDELIEPENGDVYLFVAVKDGSMSMDQCTGIEANDRICRRYVLRPNEIISDFLGRSFIAPVVGNEKTAGIADPLQLALEKTAEKHQWFTSKEQRKWREAFLSGKSSTEIINLLFKS